MELFGLLFIWTLLAIALSTGDWEERYLESEREKEAEKAKERELIAEAVAKRLGK